MKDKLFQESMVYLQAMYGKELPETVIKIYWSRFKTWTDTKYTEVVTKIFNSFVPTAQVPFPLVPHFLKAAGDDDESRGRNAIKHVRDCIRAYGRDRSVNMGDEKLHFVIRSYGGWPAICDWSDNDWRIKETAFVQSYLAAPDTAGDSPHLIGVAERENASNGYDIQPAILAIQRSHDTNVLEQKNEQNFIEKNS